jgi:spore coat polysaccharide biosynthesis protein SpsF (cytidylyltransferase family)
MSNKQTAVEWLLDRIEDVDLTEKLWENVKQQAKEMEKEQIMDAVKYGYKKDNYTPNFKEQQELFEQYYEQTYGGNK